MSDKLIGTKPNQVPTNADLGSMARQNKESVITSASDDRSLTVKRRDSDGEHLALTRDATTPLTLGSYAAGAGGYMNASSYMSLRIAGGDMLTLNNGNLYPTTDTGVSLGLSNRHFNNLHMSGTAYIDGEVQSASYSHTHNLPTVRPSLLLDFANAKALDPRITFTRGSTATYWDGETKEKAEENFIRNADSYWEGAGTAAPTITKNTTDTRAPDGTYTAHKAVVSTANSNAYSCIRANTDESTYLEENGVVSFYAKCATSTQVVDFWVWGSPVDHVTQLTLTTEWQRFSVQVDAGTWGEILNVGLVQGTYGGSAGTNYSRTFYIWGAQAESGRSSPTAYTATTDKPIRKYQPVLQTAASNTPRFNHDPVTGQSRGLHLEAGGTNIEPYSNMSTNWTTGPSASVEQGVVAPDGSDEGWTYTKAQDSGNGYWRPSPLNFPSNQTTPYCFSVFIKKDNWRYVGLRTAGGTMGSGASGSEHAVFDFDTETFSSTSDYQHPNGGTGFEYVGNGWYRVWVWRKNWNATYEQGLSSYYGLCAMKSPTHRAENWDSSSESVAPRFYAWGAQFESNFAPTSFIPTSGSSVSRSADNCYIGNLQTSDWYSSGAGTFYVHGAMDHFYTSQGLVSFYQEGHGNDWQGVYSNAPNSDGTAVYTVTGYWNKYDTVDGSNTNTLGVGGLEPKELIKTAYSWDDTGSSLAMAGVGGTYPTTAINVAHTNLSFTQLYQSGFGNRASHVRKFSFYPTRLSEATLIALTED